MGPSTSDAAMKDAPTMLRTEECASGMEQRSNYAASMVAPIKSNEEEYAKGMGPIAILTTNLLRLLHRTDQHLMTQLQLFPIIMIPQLLPIKSKVVMEVPQV